MEDFLPVVSSTYSLCIGIVCVDYIQELPLSDLAFDFSSHVSSLVLLNRS